MADVEIVVPKVGESISEATIAKWLKKVGEAVKIDEPVVELETDKVSVAVPAPKAGVLVEQRAAVGAVVKIGEVIGRLDPNALPTAQASAAAEVKAKADVPPAETPKKPKTNGDGQTRHAPPSVRRGLRPGPEPVSAAPSPPAPPSPRTVGSIAAGSGLEEVVAMSPLRRRIAERLVEAQKSAAILTTFNEVDMSAVMTLRAQHQEAFTQRYGIKLGFMSFFAKACVESLKDYPGVNAEIRGTDVVYKKFYHLGIAVGGGKGLVVPVVRDVDRMGFADIEQAIAKLAEKARNNTLTLDELTGGTFSITNGGIYGSMMSTPLLNPPQTGILGMHNIVKRPIAVGEDIKLRPMMYIALSYDHRVVDGREAVQFLVGVKQRIEAPERMLVGI